MLQACRRHLGSSFPLKSSRLLCNTFISSKNYSSDSNRGGWEFRGFKISTAVSLIGGALIGGGVLLAREKWVREAELSPVAAAKLPIYSMAEVAKHKTKEDGIWVTFNGKVYDITDFVDQHPGGNKILAASGGALEPFWALYAVHKQPGIVKMLNKYEIGVLNAEEVHTQNDPTDPFSNDPLRHPALEVVSAKPFNAESPPMLITDSFNTPNALFFVRNHLPVPTVDEKTFRVQVKGMDATAKPVSLSLAELKALPKTTISATIMCAGNRRFDMNKFKAVKGLEWKRTAVSNATWSGVLLTDLLKAKGISDANCKHVQFVGLDKDITGAAYGSSVPAEVALDPRADVLIAYEMNGEAIPIDHGFPLRVVIPGVVGARSVKWLSDIILSTEESESHWQQNDYKTFSPSTDWSTLDFKKSPAIMEPPVISAICVPQPGAVIDDEETLEVHGYAWSGGGRGIIRVELSIDGGQTWHLAEMEQADQPLRRQWAWTLWRADLDLPVPPKGSSQEVEIICKAVDTSQATQPETFKGTWNVRGLISNAWHRVPITVKGSD